MRPLLIVLCLTLCCTPVWAQPPDPKSPSPQKHAIRESRGHKAPMRDGVKLSVDIYRPIGDGKYPAILVHTPYNNNSPGWTDRANSTASMAKNRYGRTSQPEISAPRAAGSTRLNS